MKTILSNTQQQFLTKYKKDQYLKKTFYLTGGTALAEYYLHHRLSEDLDFFCQNQFNIDYVDLYFLLKKYQLKNIRVDVEAKFGFVFDDITIGALFMRVEKARIIPKMIKPLTIDELIIFFKNQAANLKNNIFDN